MTIAHKAPTMKDVKETITTEVRALDINVKRATASLITTPKNAAEVEVANGQFQTLKGIEKEIKAKEDKIIKPLNEAKNGVWELFKPVKTRLADAITSVRKGLDDYNRAAKARLAELEAKVEKKVEDGRMSEVAAAGRLAREGEKLGAGAIPTTTHKVVKVTDESLIPKRYFVLDMIAVRRDALAGVTIPGVVVEEEEIVVARRG